MFLTDGYPYEGNPNQVVEYKYLKEVYSYLTVNAIQYEMGDVIINPLKEVSDNQYIAYTTNLNVSGFDTSQVTNMATMFGYCTSLISLDLSDFNTSNVGSIMGCDLFQSINLSSFDTSKVTNMACMFLNCGSLSELDISNFNTSKVTTFEQMFHGCSSLASLDFTKFDTSKATNMASIFFGCSNLTELDLSSFDTSNVANMNNMFYNCSNLRKLNMQNADFSSVIGYTNMFSHIYNLEVIVKDEVARSFMQDRLGSNGTAIISV